MAIATCGNSNTLAIALASLKLLATYPELALSVAPKRSAFGQRIDRLTHTQKKSKISARSSIFTAMLILFTLMFLTRSVAAHMNNNNLPVATDQIKQLLTDNQANYKEQLFKYIKAGKAHEIFLVSTINGKPIYAYLDGILASDNEMLQIANLLNKNRTVTPIEIPESQKNPVLIQQDLHWKIYKKTDSINKLIQLTKLNLITHPSVNLNHRLMELNKQVNTLNQEEVALSMKEYRKEVKQIPIDVKLHVLLTQIIVKKEYTVNERKQLNDLADKKKWLTKLLTPSI